MPLFSIDNTSLKKKSTFLTNRLTRLYMINELSGKTSYRVNRCKNQIFISSTVPHYYACIIFRVREQWDQRPGWVGNHISDTPQPSAPVQAADGTDCINTTFPQVFYVTSPDLSQTHWLDCFHAITRSLFFPFQTSNTWWIFSQNKL